MRKLVLALLLALAGCIGGTEFSYRSAREIPEGPGLFTGERGAFVIGVGDPPTAARQSRPQVGLPADRPPTGRYEPLP